MQRYVEMGFDETQASEASSKFGDDLHAGCHWLMLQETMGRVPKRLKTTHTPTTQTFIGSEIKYFDHTWRVRDYDERHALIRITAPTYQVRWVHISDPRIEWVHTHHLTNSSTVPRIIWKRRLGSFKYSLEHMKGEFPRKEDMVKHIMKRGMPGWSSTQSIAMSEHSLWSAICECSAEFVHRPSTPQPLGATQYNIHKFRVERMSYFHALCDCLLYTSPSPRD